MNKSRETWRQDDGGRTARISISTTLLVEESPKAVEIPDAHEEVSSVVVLQALALRVLQTVLRMS